MNANLHLRNWIWAGIAMLVAVFVMRWLPTLDVHAQTESTEQPFISPLPAPAFLTQEAKIALDFISTHHDLPVDELQIVNEHTRIYPLIGRTFKAFTIWTQDPAKFQDFELLVEVESGVVEPDVKAISAQEQAAYLVKYGRLAPDLYERLQQAKYDELLPIAVWLAPDPVARTQEEIYAELAGRFPGAAESLVESGVPWTVEDKTMAETIRQTYFAMLAEDALRSMQPLVEQLASLGAKATTLEPLPSLFVQLPKRDLLALAERKDVELIYLLENEAEPAMVEAAATDRMPTSWRQGSLSGTGRSIAVLEPDNIQNTGCLNIVASRPGVRPGGYDPNHKTWVASVLACNNATYRGIAYNANVIDAGFDDPNRDPDLAAAMQWAVQTQNADVVNASFSSNSTQTMQWEDRVLDYWVRYGPTVIVVAAGNNTVNVTSPGKGWNVITVGAIDDQGTANWSDDAMWGGSNYANPTSTHNDREKPELAALGANITTIGPGGNSVTRDGTSLAAPQAAGLAVLLMNRNAALVDRSEAVKAVLMAGAAHNVRDSRVMPTGQDLYDGAGSIDAALSLQTAELGYTANNAATCDRPCWWVTDSLYVAPGANVSRSFHAVRGERIRVAIAWFSNGDPFYWFDGLSVNYNLQVLAPSGGQVIDGYSASWDNANELVEFVAPETGIYAIRAIRSASDTSSESNELGIAWSKQATYLPDVRGNVDGWTSTLVVRNDGAEPRPVRVTYFYASGVYAGETNTTLNQDQNWRITPPGGLGYGAAIVDGREDLSVVALQDHANPYTLDAYAGVATAQTTVHIPIVQKGNSGWYSDLFLYNPNAQNATATLTFTPAPGLGNAWSASYGIGANGQVRLYTGNLPALGTKFVGSVQVSADRPLAVAATQYNGASQLMAWSSSQPLAATLSAPLIQNNNAGWLSGLTLRAPGGNLPISAAYRVGNSGGGCAGETWWNNPQIVYPAPQGNPPGCGTTPNATFSAGGELAATVNQLQGTLNATTYEAIAAPAQSASIPKVQRDAYWNDGFVVMNVNNTAVNVTVRLYNSDGALNSTPFTNHSLGANQSLTVLAQIPQGFDGSALVTADLPVAVIANAWRPGAGAGDVIGSYPASHR